MSAVPDPYERQKNFTNFNPENSGQPTVGGDLEAELNAIETAFAERDARAAEIQRNDGALKNKVVTPDSLSDAVRALLVADGTIGAWAAATSYAIGDTVTVAGSGTYVAAVAHTSSGSFATDNAAGYWLALDASNAAATSAAAAEASATTATTKAVEADTSAGLAASSATDAATSEAAAEGAAGDAADSAVTSQTGATNSAASAVAAAASAVVASAAASEAQGYADAVTSFRGLFDSTADALSNGVNSLVITGAGSGGTNGSFVGTFTGGGGSEATFSFTVSGGAVVAATVEITSPGKNYTSTPTPVFTASAGLTGVTASVGIGANASLGESFGVRLASPNPRLYEGYKVVAGPSAQATNDAPSIDAVADTYKITETVDTVVIGMPTTYPRWALMMWDDAGDLRVKEQIDDTDLYTYGNVVSNDLVTKDQLGYSGTVTGMPAGYPELVEIGVDEDGETRVLYYRDDSGQYFYGASSGASAVGQVGSSAVPLMYDMFCLGGQSNMDGRGEGPGTEVAAGIGYFYNFNTASIDAFVEPNAAISASSDYTMLAPFINEYYRRTGRGVIVVAGAKGGTSLQDDGTTDAWDTGTIGNLTARMVSRTTAAQALATTAGMAWRMAGELWCQGENDAQQIDAATPGFTKAGYKAAFARHVTTVRAGLGAALPVFVLQTGRQDPDTSGYQQIRAAQAELAQEIAGCSLAANFAVNFHGNGRMKPDALHFNQTGLNDYGAYAAVAAAARI